MHFLFSLAGFQIVFFFLFEVEAVEIAVSGFSGENHYSLALK